MLSVSRSTGSQKQVAERPFSSPSPCSCTVACAPTQAWRGTCAPPPWPASLLERFSPRGCFPLRSYLPFPLPKLPPQSHDLLLCFPHCLGTDAVTLDLALFLVRAPCCRPRKTPPAPKVLVFDDGAGLWLLPHSAVCLPAGRRSACKPAGGCI